MSEDILRRLVIEGVVDVFKSDGDQPIAYTSDGSINLSDDEYAFLRALVTERWTK